MSNNLTIEEEAKRSLLLSDIVNDLSVNLLKEDKEFDRFVERFTEVFLVPDNTENFYFDHSIIFSIVGNIKSIECSDRSIEKLTENLRAIFDYYILKKTIDYKFYEPFKEFYDYINLEIATIDYADRIKNEIGNVEKKFNDKIEVIQNTVKEIDEIKENYQKQLVEINNIKNNSDNQLKKINDIKDNSDNQLKEINDMKTQYISILGIFSSVVLAFTGSLAFSSSVLNNLKSISLSKLLVVASVIALFFFNIIYLMFSFIKYIKEGKQQKFLCWNTFVYIIFTIIISFVFGISLHNYNKIIESTISKPVVEEIIINENANSETPSVKDDSENEAKISEESIPDSSAD